MSRPIAQRLANVPKKSVWFELTPLSAECGAVNLGQGFPNFEPPHFVRDALSNIAENASPMEHQYGRPLGHLQLVNQLKKLHQPLLNRTIADNEICVTNGVTQGLNLACQALISDGDEVITFQPAFDVYANDIEMAGGHVKFVSLKPSVESADKWTFNPSDLEAVVTPRTKAILLNTPMNVPGKVWSRDELQTVADIAIKNDLYVISDEVYTPLVYDGLQHISIASLPGMQERTLTMCSAGKMFTCTGWKIGWIIAPSDLIIAINQVLAHQCFCVSTASQAAVAKCLESTNNTSFFPDLAKDYQGRRDRLCNVLESVGLHPIRPSGGFFVLVDIKDFDKNVYVDPDEKEVGLDWQFCRWLTRHIKVGAIPTSAFTTAQTRSTYETFVRFAFCKRLEDIDLAGKRLQELNKFKSA